jgi:hypothetical protein
MCDYVHAPFNPSFATSTNHGAWIPMELGFCWAIELKSFNYYVLVMIEHFLKWIELPPFETKIMRGLFMHF